MSRVKINTPAAVALVAVAAVGLGALVAVFGRSGTTASQGAGMAAAATSAPGPASAAGGPPSSPVRVPSAANMLAPAGGAKYVGAATPDGLSGLAAFQTATGTSPSLDERFTDFGQAFPAAGVRQALAQGAYTLVSWQSNAVPLEQIAAGEDDGYLRGFAAAVKAFTRPVFLDFDHEFNGDWYPWGTEAVSPKTFVAAWRHIHDVFAAAGADNALWVWSPNVVNPVPNVDLAAYWPGAAYVEVVGMVGYFTGQLGEDSYPGLFGRTEKVVDAFADKPFLITEAGAEQGTEKPAWISDLIRGVRGDPRMLGFVYFDFGSAQGKREDWTLEDDPAAVSAWRAATDGMPLVTATPAGAPSCAC